jgi:polyketide biosynthesis acyl carrier protein
MNKEDVFQAVKKNIVEILPHVSLNNIKIDGQLKDLGANSIDRMEIVTMSMEALGIKIPLVELGQVENIEGLVNLLYERKMKALKI